MEKQRIEQKLVVPNQLAELVTIAQFLEELPANWELSGPLVMTLQLVVEEAFTNVVQYAYNDEQLHHIELEVQLENNVLRLVIQDDGVPYDPTVKQDPDTLLSVDERQIGGLGIFLIKQMMDRVAYERTGDKNRLIMEKDL
jgi:serine/threonine-protein kinase RsbW